MPRRSSAGRDGYQGQEGASQSHDSHAHYATHDQTVPQQHYYQPNGSAYNSHASSQYYAQQQQQQQQQYNTSHRWQAVPRPWSSQYPDDHGISPGHSNAGSPSFPLNSPHYSVPYSHGYAASNSRPPTTTQQNDGHHPNYTHSTHGSQSTDGSAPPPPPPPGLTRAQLDQLGAERPRTSNLSLWRGEDQREGGWNGVGYVSVSVPVNARDRDERRRDG